MKHTKFYDKLIKMGKIEVPQNVQQFFYELFFLSYVGWAQLHRKTLKKNF